MTQRQRAVIESSRTPQGVFAWDATPPFPPVNGNTLFHANILLAPPDFPRLSGRGYGQRLGIASPSATRASRLVLRIPRRPSGAPDRRVEVAEDQVLQGGEKNVGHERPARRLG